MHSPEPWKRDLMEPWGDGHLGYFRIEDKSGHHVATVPTDTVGGTAVGHGRDQADRIVACVNACKGIPTEKLSPIAGKGPPLDGSSGTLAPHGALYFDKTNGVWYGQAGTPECAVWIAEDTGEI